MNELQSAFGLVQLKHVNEYIARRKAIAELYREKLEGIKGIRILYDIEGIEHSYTYFPVLIDLELYGSSRDEVYEKLKGNNIFGRRYFYPLISRFPIYRGLPSAGKNNLPVAGRIAEQVICLPIYPDLDHKIIDLIVNLLTKK
jgi:dTDP-4-amino-4,6-dideoxygalactose transaminase